MVLSTFTWLDHREEDANRVREALAAFDQPGTLDPLGFGIVRDAFSELLFPGITTVQTRARYFLLVPWAFRWLEWERVPPRRALARARELEAELIAALIAGSAERSGIIGQRTGAATVQMPSLIYWGGLDTFGIRRFVGSRSDYAHAARRLADRPPSADEDGADDPTTGRAWHPDLPVEPDGLWETATLDLLPEEAMFLADRIAESVPDTYLAHLVRDARIGDEADLPWEHPASLEASTDIRLQLHHARLFAFSVHGAGLLYNWLLSRKLDEEQGGGLPVDYGAEWEKWLAEIDRLASELRAWDLGEMWSTVYRQNPAISSSHRTFIDGWLDAVIRGPRSLDLADAERRLIVRESAIKGPRAKLASRAARERYPTAQGDTLMTYRWPQAQRIVTDILEGQASAQSV
jgi:hypothetical protein